MSPPGAFALADASRDAAAVVSLQPGGYTVVESGVGNTTGNALVEVYEMPVTAAAVAGPTITAQPQSSTVSSGTGATLSVSAGGIELSYQWFIGSTGDTSRPINGATAASFSTGPLATTTRYWVRVSNAGGAVSSTTATISVNSLPPTLNQGLVAYLPMEGNATDVSGTGNHGTIRGGVSFVSGTAGQAAEFNGTTGYIEIPHSASLNLSTALSIAFWVKQPSTATGSYPNTWRFVDKITSGSANGWHFACYTINGVPSRLAFSTGVGGLNSSQAIPLNAWAHVAVTYDRGQVSLFINGVAVTSGSADPVLPQNTLSVLVGNSHGSNVIFRGSMDELRIYNLALTAGEVAQLSGGSAP